MVRDPFADDEAPDLQDVLDALDDPDCRAILRALDEPMTAREIMSECDLSQTTAYRKLDLLSEASLVDEETEIRTDGHHATRYRRSFAGVLIGLTDDDLFEVTMIRREETADERLARFWSEISDQL
jgi:DNA-binding transcriptional ArsR family regulator